MAEVRNCQHCGAEMTRQYHAYRCLPAGRRLESNRRFRARKFCSRSCQYAARTYSPEQKREAVRASNRKQYEKAKERDRVSGRPVSWRLAALRKNYGVTEEDFNRMYDEQGGVCAVCGGGPRGNHKYLSVDHDHSTGVVRGLLCTTCNPAIGMFKDSPELLRRAADYLESRR